MTAALGLGFAAAGASAHDGDPVEDAPVMHEEMHIGRHDMGMAMGEHTTTEMDEMHAEMFARLSEEDRAQHEHMHRACDTNTSERRDG